MFDLFGFLSPIAFYVGLGGLLTLEEAGLFLLPGDISMVAAGMYAAQGGPFIVLSWLVSSVGMVLGSLLLFQAVQRSTTSTRIMPARARALVVKHGAIGVGVARLFPGLRSATVFAAASSCMPRRTFLLGLIPAAAVWAAVLLALGYFGGQAILDLLGRIDHSRTLRLLSGLLLLAAVSFVIYRIRASREAPEL